MTRGGKEWMIVLEDVCVKDSSKGLDLILPLLRLRIDPSSLMTSEDLL